MRANPTTRVTHECEIVDGAARGLGLTDRLGGETRDEVVMRAATKPEHTEPSPRGELSATERPERVLDRSTFFHGQKCGQGAAPQGGPSPFSRRGVTRGRALVTAVASEASAGRRASRNVAGMTGLTPDRAPLDRLVVDLSAAQKVFLISPRRYGKSSLDRHALAALERRGALAIDVTVSSFSSYGMSPDLDLKPDIGAPGGLINSTYPMAKGGYATVSGTSMSAPHVAGGVALLLEARPDLDAHDVRGVLQNTADPTAWWGNPGMDALDNVHRQGAGMLDVPGSILATTNLYPSKLPLGATEGPVTETLTIANDGDEKATYEISHEPALGTHGSTFTPSFNDEFAEASFSKEKVTLAPGASAEFDVTVTPPARDHAQMLYGGYVKVAEVDGESYRVPYAAYNGDYQEIEAMTPITDADGDVHELPWLTRITGCDVFSGLECADSNGGTFQNQPDGATYTLEWVDGLPDVPYVIAHFDHHVTKLEMTVINERTGRPVHPDRNVAVSVDHVNRNATSTAFFSYVWDGTVVDSRDRVKPVRDGQYRLEARALKALGDPDNLTRFDYIILGVLCVDGFLLGIASVLFLPSYLGAVPFPVSVFAAAVGNILLVEAARRLGIGRALAALPAAAWMIAVMLAYAGGPGGDIVIPAADARGLFLVLGGLVPQADAPACFLPVGGRLYFRKQQLPATGEPFRWN